MNDADRKLLPLVSGWLDGELSPQDTARVEAALERSAELRAIVDAWRRLDDVVPRHEVARSDAAWEALALRVENAIAADEAARAAPLQPARPSTASSPGWLDRLWAGFGSHRWAVGGGGALVAALLLLLLWPDPQGLLRNAGVLEDVPAPSMQTTPPAGAGSAPDGPIARHQGEKTPVDTDASTVSEAEGTDRLEERQTEQARPQEEQKADRSLSIAKQTRPARDQAAGSPPASPPPAPTQEHAPIIAEPQLIASEAKDASTEPEIGAPEISTRKTTDEALYVRGGRSQEVGARIDAVGPRPKREDDASGESHVQRQMLAAPPQSSGMSYRMSGPADDTWRIQMEADLQSAISAGDRDDLQRLVTELDRHRSDRPEENEDIATLDLAVRARAELLRLSGDDAEACVRLRGDWAAWQRLAGPERDASWEGLRLRNLVQDVCPE